MRKCNLDIIGNKIILDFKQQIQFIIIRFVLVDCEGKFVNRRNIWNFGFE